MRLPVGTLRRAACGLAAAGLTTLGLAGAAHAEPVNPVFELRSPAEVAVHPYPSSGAPDQASLDVTLDYNAEGLGDDPTEDEINDAVYQKDYTVTIDASSLAGKATVTMPRECDATGMVAVCHDSGIFPGTGHEVGTLKIAAAEGSTPGDTGTVTVTGKGEGATFKSSTTKVVVGGNEFRMRELSEPAGFKPGDTFQAPLAFRNQGGLPVDGVLLEAYGSRGLTFPDTYSNCFYADLNEKGDLIRERRHVLCAIQGTFQPGTGYELKTPLPVKTADFALLDNLGYRFSAFSQEKLDELRGLYDYKPGSGAGLGLQQAAGSASYVKYAELDFPTKNTADLEVTGGSAKGGKGDTVEVKVGLKNNGPGWIGSLRAGGESIAFTVDVPEGATVTKVPDACSKRTGESGYLCWGRTPMLEDAAYSYPFELRIDKVVPGAVGEVVLPGDDRHDPDKANNTAKIVLNGSGDQGSGSGGGADGGSGSGGGSGGDHGQAAGGSGDQGAGDEGGGLALTGAGGILLIVGVAAVALGAGGWFYLVSRRRAGSGGAAV